MTTASSHIISRSPVVVVMGHIDHGKSTLLDYIRKTNIVAGEAGGITQHMAAYEALHKKADGTHARITFIDTPGHEAFTELRSRGAKVADIAILVVSAEDGVKPQTLDALRSIIDARIPYIVAINKIDKPNANIEKTKQSLAENDILIEEWGGKIPYVPISAKTGQGVDDLLEMVILAAELEGLTGDTSLPASGIVLEAHIHKTKGVTATLIIKNGTLTTGGCIISEHAYAPLRVIEDFKGEKITEATFSSPVQIVGWTELPTVGAQWTVCDNKKEAEAQTKIYTIEHSHTGGDLSEKDTTCEYLPLIIKADAAGTIDAILHEIKKLENEKIKAKVVFAGVGDITEADVKQALGKSGTVIVGFNVRTDAQARGLSERDAVEIKTFSIIYELGTYLSELFENRTPKVDVEETVGELKVLKYFSSTKHKHVIGGKVIEGKIHVKRTAKILRRNEDMGTGTIIELQHAKTKASEIEEGKECGMLFESPIVPEPGDILRVVVIVKK